jgi:hypothetical protein
MGALQDDRLDLRRVIDPDPETVTARRLKANADLGIYLPPSQYELEFYAREGKTPPAE